MPWLPLAILLIVALTVAALALILFPPGEGGEDSASAEASGEPSSGEGGTQAQQGDESAEGASEYPSPDQMA